MPNSEMMIDRNSSTKTIAKQLVDRICRYCCFDCRLVVRLHVRVVLRARIASSLRLGVLRSTRRARRSRTPSVERLLDVRVVGVERDRVVVQERVRSRRCRRPCSCCLPGRRERHRDRARRPCRPLPSASVRDTSTVFGLREVRQRPRDHRARPRPARSSTGRSPTGNVSEVPAFASPCRSATPPRSPDPSEDRPPAASRTGVNWFDEFSVRSARRTSIEGRRRRCLERCREHRDERDQAETDHQGRPRSRRCAAGCGSRSRSPSLPAIRPPERRRRSRRRAARANSGESSRDAEERERGAEPDDEAGVRDAPEQGGRDARSRRRRASRSCRRSPAADRGARGRRSRAAPRSAPAGISQQCREYKL